MNQVTHFLSTSPGRAFGLIFALLFLLLTYFGISSAAGVGGLGMYAIAMFQMLMLAMIVAPFVFAVVFLGGDEAH